MHRCLTNMDPSSLWTQIFSLSWFSGWLKLWSTRWRRLFPGHRQQAQAASKENVVRYKEQKFRAGALPAERLPGEAAEPPSSGALKDLLDMDTALSNLLWLCSWPALSRRLGDMTSRGLSQTELFYDYHTKEKGGYSLVIWLHPKAYHKFIQKSVALDFCD